MRRPSAGTRGWRWRSCRTLLGVDEAEEHVLEAEANEAVLGQGQVVFEGEAGDLALDGEAGVRLDAQEVGAVVAVARVGLDADHAGQPGEGDAGVVGRADEADPDQIAGEAFEELARRRRTDQAALIED